MTNTTNKELLTGEAFVLNDSNDFLGTLPKANLITDIIKNNSSFFKADKMIALYGGWGTGKSTVMKTIKESLNSFNNGLNFSCYEFETWKYEKDENLALSLLAFIIDNLKSQISFNLVDKAFYKDLFRLAKSVFKNSNITLGPVEVNASAVVDDMIPTNNSLYKKVKQLEELFLEFEERILTNLKQTLVIFIDDLDRCESENIINLLSAIKHFFNLGEKVIFVVGVDKSAVTKALNVKYGDLEKAEEYLEKIFTMSFELNEDNYNIEKFINANWSLSNPEYITPLLNALEFNNPRHIKKFVNKINLFCKIANTHNSKHKYVLDSIEHHEVNLIFFCYFLLLKEFYSKEYKDLSNHSFKTNQFQNFVSDDKKFLPYFDPNKTLDYYLNNFNSKSYFNTLVFFNFIFPVPNKSINLTVYTFNATRNNFNRDSSLDKISALNNTASFFIASELLTSISDNSIQDKFSKYFISYFDGKLSNISEKPITFKKLLDTVNELF